MNLIISAADNDLQTRLGTAPLTHIVTEDVTSRKEFGTVSPITTQGVANGENVTCNGNDVNLDSGLGTAPLTQIVTGDVIGMTGLDTILPKCARGVASGENESDHGCDMESRLGTAPMTLNVRCDRYNRVCHKIEHNVG